MKKFYFCSEAEKYENLQVDSSLFIPRKPIELIGEDTAIIHVSGLLESEAPSIFESAGIGSTYETILNELLNLPQNVKEVIFQIDSCGGNVKHLQELAMFIKKLGDKYSTVAYVSGICASAAYYLACSCNKIYCTQSGEVGSIGTICIIDDAGEEGKKIIVSSDAVLKIRTDENKAEYDAYLQERVNKLATQFQNWVKQNREIENEAAVFSGKLFSSDEAEQLGLIDGIFSFNDFMIFHHLNDCNKG